MRKLITIDLTSANIHSFESYERKVIPLLLKYGATLESSVRSVDANTEIHILHFPDASSFENFLTDPSRVALKDEWINAGAASTITDVEKTDYL